MLPVFAYGLAARRKYGDIFKVGNMDNVYLVGGLRSYVGVVNGMYRHVPAEKLGAAVLKQVMAKYAVPKPDYIIAGNGVGAGGNIARLMAWKALRWLRPRLPVAKQSALLRVDLKVAAPSRDVVITPIIRTTLGRAGIVWLSLCPIFIGKR